MSAALIYASNEGTFETRPLPRAHAYPGRAGDPLHQQPADTGVLCRFRIFQRGDSWWLENAGAAGATALNSVIVSGAQRLEHLDEIRCGDATLHFKCLDEPQPAHPPRPKPAPDAPRPQPAPGEDAEKRFLSEQILQKDIEIAVLRAQIERQELLLKKLAQGLPRS